MPHLHAPDDTHTSTTTAESCFENDRQTILLTELLRFIRRRHRALGTRNHLHTCNHVPWWHGLTAFLQRITHTPSSDHWPALFCVSATCGHTITQSKFPFHLCMCGKQSVICQFLRLWCHQRWQGSKRGKAARRGLKCCTDLDWLYQCW